MIPEPRSHRFVIDANHYTLREYTRAGERRINQRYALALSLNGTTPGLMQTLDGDNLYIEAVAMECLTEAPDFWWEYMPAPPATPATPNGSRQRTVTFEQVPPLIWKAFCKEAEAFLASLFPVAPTTLERPSDARPEESDRLAAAQTVSPGFLGRAE